MVYDTPVDHSARVLNFERYLPITIDAIRKVYFTTFVRVTLIQDGVSFRHIFVLHTCWFDSL